MNILRVISVGAVCLCFLLVACEPAADITPVPATEEMQRRLETRLAPGIEVSDIYQHPLGETDDPIFKPEGLVVAGLVQGGRYDGEVVVAYIESDGGRFANLLSSTSRIDAARARRTYGEYPNARALANYVKGLR